MPTFLFYIGFMFEKILLLFLSGIGGLYDVKSRRIPNWLTLGVPVLLLVFYALQFKISGVLNCIIGFSVGVLLLIVPYLLGGMGAGDVKLLGVIGAVIGWKDVISVFVYSALAGFFLALLWIIITPGHLKYLITTGKIFPVLDKKEKMPYGLAILAGTIVYVLIGSYNFFGLSSH